MERKNNILNKIFSPKLLIIEWSFIVLFCIFIGCSVRAAAATSTNFDLPLTIGIPDQLSDLGITTDIVNNVKNQYFTILAGYGNDVSSNYTIFVEQIDSNNVVYITATNLLEITNSSQITTDYLLTYRNLGQHFVQFTYDPNTGVLSNGNFYGGWVASWQYFSKQTMAIGKGWILDSAVEFPNYWVFSPLSVNGHATPPDLSGDNIGSDKPDIDDYIPTQPNQPTFDDSSLESMVESLYNWLKWEYNAITSTIKGFINYLGDTITYSIQKVIDNIKNAIQNFYDNMVSLFEPLLNGIMQTLDIIKIGLEVFFSPFDEDQFQEAYNNCQFIAAVDGFNDSIEEFEHAFEYAEERDYFTLYLGFIMDGYTVNYDLDFTWLYPLRQYYRPIIWCVVVYEFFVYLCAQLSDYLQGRSGK